MPAPPDDPYAPPAAPLEYAAPPEPQGWAAFAHDRRAAIISNLISAALFALVAVAMDDAWPPAAALSAMYALAAASLWGWRAQRWLRALMLAVTGLATAGMLLVLWVALYRETSLLVMLVAGSALMVVLVVPSAAYWWVTLRAAGTPAPKR